MPPSYHCAICDKLAFPYNSYLTDDGKRFVHRECGEPAAPLVPGEAIMRGFTIFDAETGEHLAGPPLVEEPQRGRVS